MPYSCLETFYNYLQIRYEDIGKVINLTKVSPCCFAKRNEFFRSLTRKQENLGNFDLHLAYSERQNLIHVCMYVASNQLLGFAYCYVCILCEDKK